ncbi:MAG: hypothetical protein QXP01_06180 [Candidatus Hadarchaeum sp.]
MKLIIPFFQDGNMNKLADVVRTLARTLPSLVDGTILEFTVTPSGISVRHGLERKPQGFFVIMKRQAMDVWVTAEDEVSMTFYSSASGEVKVWVF